MCSSTTIGARAEIIACTFLKKQGLTFIEKNYFVTDVVGKKIGEIDLIMQDNEFLVFVEVKKRNKMDYGDVLEMVTPQKRSRIIRTATHFLMARNQFDKTYCRFDIVGISPDKERPIVQKIEWIKDAFQVQY